MQDGTEQMSFGKALDILKANPEINCMTRTNWYGTKARPMVHLQMPDDHSKMTEPYLYMEKDSPTMSGGYKVRFPLDLSCESILADDWIVLRK